MATNQEKFARPVEPVISSSSQPMRHSMTVQKPVRKSTAISKLRAVPILPKQVPPVIPRAVPLAPRPSLPPSASTPLVVTPNLKPNPPSASDSMLPTATSFIADEDEPPTPDKPKTSRTRTFTEDDDLELIRFWQAHIVTYSRTSKLSFARRATKHLNAYFEAASPGAVLTHEKQVHNKMCYMLRRYEAVHQKYLYTVRSPDAVSTAVSQANAEFLYFSRMYDFLGSSLDSRNGPRKRKNSRSSCASLPDMTPHCTTDETPPSGIVSACDDAADRVSVDNPAGTTEKSGGGGSGGEGGSNGFTIGEQQASKRPKVAEHDTGCNGSNDKVSTAAGDAVTTAGGQTDASHGGREDVEMGAVVSTHNMEDISRSGELQDGPGEGMDADGAITAEMGSDSFKAGTTTVPSMAAAVAATVEATATVAGTAAMESAAVETNEVTDGGERDLTKDIGFKEKELQLRREELLLKEREVQNMEEEMALKRADLQHRSEDCASRRDMQLVEQLRESAKAFVEVGMRDKANKCMEKVAALLKL